MIVKAALTAVFLAMSLSRIEASTITFSNNTGGAILDGAPGVPSDILVSDSRFIAPAGSNITVTIIGLRHSFAGDLVATLTGPSSISRDLFNRIGKDANSDFGCSCNFDGNYDFNSSFSGDIWTVASGLGDADAIPSGSYWTTSAGSNASTNLSMAYNGLPAGGVWRLTISDNSPDDPPDDGSFLGWTLSLNVVDTPEPSFAIPLGLLGLALALFRRRGVRNWPSGSGGADRNRTGA